MPEVGERFPDLPTLSGDFPEARQARLSRAVGQLLATALGPGPSLLMVDDMQWADDASAQVLHHLARHDAERPMLVIYAYRDEDVDSDERLARLVESLCREADARRLPLQRLDAVRHRRIWWRRCADADPSDTDLAERLHRETEGNPFFLMSMLQSLSEGETHPDVPARACCPAACPRPCAPPCACASRTCPRPSGRCSRLPPCSAGASTSTPCSK